MLLKIFSVHRSNAHRYIKNSSSAQHLIQPHQQQQDPQPQQFQHSRSRISLKFVYGTEKLHIKLKVHQGLRHLRLMQVLVFLQWVPLMVLGSPPPLNGLSRHIVPLNIQNCTFHIFLICAHFIIDSFSTLDVLSLS